MEVGGGDIGTGIEGGPINPPGPGVGAALGPVGAALGPAGAVQDPGQRRRKRNEYRVKTYEIARGRFGFGFTLSGQSPCILSSVISGSPAELAGLKAGDSLVTVNNNNVSRLAHGEVVRLISQSQGLIRVQVSEGTVSESSSDDDGERRRARQPLRRQLRRADAPLSELNLNQFFKSRGDYDNIDHFSSRTKPLEDRLNSRGNAREEDRFSDGDRSRQRDRNLIKHFRSTSADSSFVGDTAPPNLIPRMGRGATPPAYTRSGATPPSYPRSGATPMSSTPSKAENAHKIQWVDLGATEELSIGGDLRDSLDPTIRQLRQSIKQHNARKFKVDLASALVQCIIGYLGTIELSLQSTTELQGIKNCIRRLRVEKKVHTLVLFSVLEDRVVLINHHGLKLAEFKSENISFCGVFEDDRRFFGLVTTQADNDDGSSSCHVFMVEPTSSEHERIQRAKVFNITPTYTLGECNEFPANADPILSVIFSIKGVEASQQNQQDEVDEIRSQSSNGDSGLDIGTVVLPTNPSNQGAARSISTNASPRSLREEGRGEEEEDPSSETENSNPRLTSKLTVRAMPDPSLASGPPSAESSFNTDRLECLQSAEHIRLSMHKYLQDKREHLKRASQQIVDQRVSGQSSHDTGLQNVQRLIKEKFELHAESGRVYTRSKPDRTEGTPTPSISERSYVRSLEDLRSISQTERTCKVDALEGEGPPSLPILSSLPLARFLYSSDSNLSEGGGPRSSWVKLPGLEAEDSWRVDPLQHPLNKWQEQQGGGFSSVLRPGEQYPDPPVKLRSRSQASNISHRSSMFEFSDYDNISTSAASTLSRRRRREPSIIEEKIEADRVSVPGDLESTVAARRDNTIDRVRTRRKSDSESIRETFGQDEKGDEKDIGRVGGWAADFDKLLNDVAGIQTFAEFLKKEFSHENIYFWCFCERFRKITLGSERLKIAQEIVDKHLGSAATEPVNVDAVARSLTADSLQAASEDSPPASDLFATAQRQIYNLMKFDSFSRFLKSDLYKDSLLADMGGTPLPFKGLDLDPLLTLDSQTTDLGETDKKKKEESRRRSILPWSNKNRSKSKDRGEQQDRPSLFRAIKLPGQSGGRASLSGDKSENKSPETRVESRNSSSRVSLDSNHQTENCETENCALTRFILPDKATTVVTPTPGESIRHLISKLLEKRGLKLTSFDAFLPGNDKPLDLAEDCASLGCTEVRVEPRVLFRLELPSKKSIGVKAKQTKLVEEVLRPILQQYGWNLDQMVVQVDRQGVKAGVEYRANVTSIDNCRLSVSYINQDLQSRALDEIIKRQSDNDSLKTDSRPGSRNSGHNLGFRRQSTSSVDSKRHEDLMPPPAKIPSMRRRQLPGSPKQSVRDQETSLYEGLKRMTQGRLDDQRGLEINGELPDFLKTAENQARKSEGWRIEREDNLLSRLSGPMELGDIHGWDKDHAHRYLDYIDSTFTSDGCIPTLDQAEDVFQGVDPDETMNFNESRLSLGLARLNIDPGGLGPGRLSIDGMKVVSRPSLGFPSGSDYEHMRRSSRGSDYASAPRGSHYDSVRTAAAPLSHDAARRTYSQEKDYEPVNFHRQSPLPHLRQSPLPHPPPYSQPSPLHPLPPPPPHYLPQPPHHQPPLPPMKPRLTSGAAPFSERFQLPPRRPPPPLPPKPLRGGGPDNSRGPLDQFGSGGRENNNPVMRTKGGGLQLGGPAPGDQGYNVSFV